LKLLLDTHVVIWMQFDPVRLPPALQAALLVADRVAVSVVSGWEHGIKRRKRPSQTPLSFEDLIAKTGFERLDLAFACHSYAESLPPIHADPFDRMLIAQALHGDWVLATGDETVRRYPVETVWD
jgi:PIN domain nuclease of toxin-antitoxin system